VKNGTLVRPTACGQCGSDTGVIHAHSDFYDRPLDVEWVCARCHGREHYGAAKRQKEKI